MGAALLAVATATYSMAIGHDGFSWTAYGIAAAITLVMPVIPWRHVRQLRGMLAA
jgi:Na+/proline symporter